MFALTAVEMSRWGGKLSKGGIPGRNMSEGRNVREICPTLEPLSVTQSIPNVSRR